MLEICSKTWCQNLYFVCLSLSNFLIEKARWKPLQPMVARSATIVVPEGNNQCKKGKIIKLEYLCDTIF